MATNGNKWQQMATMATGGLLKELFVAQVGGAGVCCEFWHGCLYSYCWWCLGIGPLERNPPVEEHVFCEHVDWGALARAGHPLLVECWPVLAAAGTAGVGETGGQDVAGSDARQTEEWLMIGVRHEELVHAIVELLV